MSVIARALRIVCAALVGVVGACTSAAEDPPTATASGALSQAGHTGGALQAFDSGVFQRDTNRVSELYWYMDKRDAALWVNDPDCPRNDCGSSPKGPIPSGEPAASWWSYLDPVTDQTLGRAMCWAIRNPDHFVGNGLWRSDVSTFAGRPPTGFDLRITSFRNDVMAAWVPRSADEAIAALRQAVAQVASGNSSKGDSQDRARAALRGAFDACHYAMDKLACGHGLGNAWCDPANPNLTWDCYQFVQFNTSDRGPLPNDRVVDATISDALRSYCTGDAQLSYPIGFSRALQYAAAERYIRHHTTQRVVEGDEFAAIPMSPFLKNFVPAAWGAPFTTSQNSCAAECTDGECVGGRPYASFGGEPEVGSACTSLVQAARDQLELNATFFMSPAFKRDPARGCRAVGNAETCGFVGGNCLPAGGRLSCFKKVSDAEGAATTVVVGTCNDGVSFGGALPPSCQYDERSTTPPVAPACVGRCRAVNGFLDVSGKCTATFTSPWGAETRDVTAAVCGELTSTNANGPCDALTPEQRCYAVGAQCANDFSHRCAVSFDLVPTYPGSSTMKASWSDETTIGTCAPSGAFNAAYPPNCQQPRTWSSITFPACAVDFGLCNNDEDCCAGSCRNPWSHEQFLPAGAPSSSYGQCEPTYPSGYAWIDYGSSGTGTGAVALSTGVSCGASCAKSVPASTPVTLTATPAPGSRLTGWTGCDAAWGSQCTVTSTNVRTVTAQFDVGATQVPGKTPIGYVDVLGTDPSTRIDGAVSGWAYDPDASAASITVRLVIDGAIAATAVADRPRPDVNAVMNVTGNHGFQMEIPWAYRKLQWHHAEVVAVDDGAGAPPAASPALPASSAAVQKDFIMGYCKIESPGPCTPWSWMVFPWYDGYDGASYGQARCTQRGPEYYSFCAMTGGWVSATLGPAPW
jgi:hypothetical protein